MRGKACFCVLGFVLLAGCGGRPPAPLGFVNQTRHTDARLWGIWRTAQQNLSHEVDLNPLQQEFADSNQLHRSEEHTSELQSPDHLVCRLLLEKKQPLTTHRR